MRVVNQLQAVATCPGAGRKAGWTAALLLAIAGWLAAGTAYGQWPDTTGSYCGRWWMEAQGNILDRPGGSLGLPLITNEVTLEPLLTSDQITDLNTSAGAAVRFGSRNRWGQDWDFGMSLGGWDSSFAFAGPDLTSPFFQGLDPDTVGIDYTSDFYNIELNLRKSFMPGFTFTTGPRYFRLTEDMNLRTSTVFDTPQGPFTFNTADLLSTTNSAVGWQIGLEYNQPINRDFYLQGFVRTSGMFNSASVQRITDDNVSDAVVDRRTKDTGMFIGTAGGRAYFGIIPGHLHSFVGYEGTWVDGVAVAPAQFLNQSTIETLPTANTIFWHALTFGLRFTY